MAEGRWSVLVVWNDGRTEYMTRYGGALARLTKREAKEMAKGFAIGLVPDEAQSVNVVRAPRG